MDRSPGGMQVKPVQLPSECICNPGFFTSLCVLRLPACQPSRHRPLWSSHAFPCGECHPLGDPPSLHRRTFGREQSGRVHPVPSWQVTLPGQASSVASLGLLLCETGSWRGGRILPSGCRCPQSLLLGTAMGSGGKGVALPVLITPRHILLVFAGVGGRETGAEGTSSGTGSFPERSRGWTHRSHLRSQLRGPQLELRRGDRTGLPCCV